MKAKHRVGYKKLGDSEGQKLNIRKCRTILAQKNKIR